jgi:filamentous hemagglutinin family protein
MCDRIEPRQEIRFTPTTLGKWFSRLVLVLGVVCTGEGTVAQIVPDETLGADSSIVTPLDALGFPVDRIDGGAIRGANLFHSFEEFNVETDRGAYFFSPNADIQNILARVTGGNPSEILGILGTFGSSEPNLFLMNPRGIVFGPNARLDVGGSFVASTADSLVFENGFEFGATNPEAPPLLTINVPIGLQYGETAGSIRVQGGGFQDFLIGRGLRVQPERTLALVGGEVNLEGGVLFAPNGRVELGSVAENSLVNLLPTASGFGLDYEGVRGFQDVGLSQAARIYSSGGNKSSIQVQGRNIILTDGSLIIAFTLGPEAGGNLSINASELVELSGGGGIRAETFGSGNGGDVRLTARQLLVQDGANVSASTGGEGDGGTLTVNVEDLVQLVGTDANGFSSSLQTITEGSGNSGTLTLKARQLLVQDGANVSASTNTNSEGNGGTLFVEVSDLVQLVGTDANGLPSGVFATAKSTGNGGNLTLTTRQLLVQDGAVVSVGTNNEGNGGSLTVKVSDLVQVIGTDSIDGSPSGITAQTIGRGNGGNLTLTTGQLLVQDGAQVSASTGGEGDGGTLTVNVEDLVQLVGTDADGFPSGILAQTFGSGNGGDVRLTARQLLVQDGAQVSASTNGEGDGGTLIVKVEDLVQLVGTDADGFPSSIDAPTAGRGNGGNLTLTTRQLLVQDGAQVFVSTIGEGDGGTLTIKVSDLVHLMGTASNSSLSSGVLASTTGTGNGGDLTLTAGQLLVQDGAVVSASTGGEGDAGTLMLDVSESVLLDGGGGIGVLSEASGNGGDLILTTDQLTVQNGSEISVSSPDSRAGNLTITANTLTLNNGEVSAETGITGAEEGANIILQDLDLLLLENESLISASALADANGGNVTINADFIVAKSPTGDQGSDITANAVRGNGGRVSVTSNGLFGIEFRPQRTPLNDITVSSQFGLAGDFIDNTPGIDPSQGLATLPSNLVDPESLIDRSCTPGSAALQSSFIITGRGGIPTSPTDPLSSDAVVSEWVTLDTEEETTAVTETPTNPTSSTPEQIIEAQGWTVNERGQVVLIANAPTVAPQAPRQTAPSCEDIRADAH